MFCKIKSRIIIKIQHTSMSICQKYRVKFIKTKLKKKKKEEREIGTNTLLVGNRSHSTCAKLCYVFKSSVASTHLSFFILSFMQNTSYPVHFGFDHTTSSVQKNVSICDITLVTQTVKNLPAMR